MKENWDNKAAGALFEAVARLKNKDEARRFLRDLLTPQEIVEFSRRWQAARMLSERNSYTKVEKTTGLSSATVARVSRWLNNGLGGYKLMLARVHHRSSSLAGRG